MHYIIGNYTRHDMEKYAKQNIDHDVLINENEFVLETL